MSIQVGDAAGSRALVRLSVSLDYLRLFPELFLFSLNLLKHWGRERPARTFIRGHELTIRRASIHVGVATGSRALVRLLFGSRSVLFCKLWGQEWPVRTFIRGHELTIRRMSIHVGDATGSRNLACLSVSLDYLGLFPELFLLSLKLVKLCCKHRAHHFPGRI